MVACDMQLSTACVPCSPHTCPHFLHNCYLATIATSAVRLSSGFKIGQSFLVTLATLLTRRLTLAPTNATPHSHTSVSHLCPHYPD